MVISDRARDWGFQNYHYRVTIWDAPDRVRVAETLDFQRSVAGEVCTGDVGAFCIEASAALGRENAHGTGLWSTNLG